MDPFSMKGYNLAEAIDGLMAYDGGATDSGIHDEELKVAVIGHLRSLSDLEFREACAKVCRKFITEESINQGYGMNDILEFADWLASYGIAPS